MLNELKTLEDLEHGEKCMNCEKIFRVGLIDVEELRQNIIKWIKTIQEKSDTHWARLDKHHYTGYEKIYGGSPFSWELEGMSFDDWHEASDPPAAIMILKHIFNITDEELK